MSISKRMETRINVKSKFNPMEKDVSTRQLKEKFFKYLFLIAALIAILSVGVIAFFIFQKGVPAIIEIGLIDFIFGKVWMPSAGVYGIWPMIIGSLVVTLGALVLGVTIGLLTAIYMAEIADEKKAKFLRTCVELLAGIPSVVYGFFGLIVLVPLISQSLGGPGNSVLAASIILGIMVLPTVISLSENAIRSVPSAYKEGSLALGASHTHTIFKVILPAAKSGIMAAVVLGIGRVIGETMAVILVAGNTPIVPKGLTSPVRTLTANIAMEMNYATGLHQEALFATGLVLFVFIMVLNLLLQVTLNKNHH